MRALFCASALLVLALAGSSALRMFTAAPALQRAAPVPYGRPPMSLQAPAYPVLGPETRIAALALMPQDRDPAPRGRGWTINWSRVKSDVSSTVSSSSFRSRVLSTVILFALIGYFSSADVQSADIPVVSTISKWLADPPVHEVPAPHYDEFGELVGRQTRPELNGGSVFLLASSFPVQALLRKAGEKLKPTRSLQQQLQEVPVDELIEIERIDNF